MTKYNINLIDHCEQMDNKWKWIAIIALSFLILSVIIWGIVKSTRSDIKAIKHSKQQEVIEKIPEQKQKEIEPAEAIEVQPQKAQNEIQKQKEPKQVVPKKVQKPDSKPKTTKKKSTTFINKKFTSSLNGYKIVGVGITRGIPPKVMVQKKKETRTLQVGETLDEYTIEEIHRTYIILKSKEKTIHLNYIH